MGLSSIPLRLSSLFKGRGLLTFFVTLSLTVNETLERPPSLPFLMEVILAVTV